MIPVLLLLSALVAVTVTGTGVIHTLLPGPGRGRRAAVLAAPSAQFALERA